MQKVIILSNRYHDFIGSDKKPVKGRSIRYIDHTIKNGEDFYYSDDDCKIWIKPEQTDLERSACSLLPGTVVELDYVVVNKRAVLSAIIPTDDVAVDFDKIFKERS